jgi:hypothetical protein
VVLPADEAPATIKAKSAKRKKRIIVESVCLCAFAFGFDRDGKCMQRESSAGVFFREKPNCARDIRGCFGFLRTPLVHFVRSATFAVCAHSSNLKVSAGRTFCTRIYGQILGSKLVSPQRFIHLGWPAFVEWGVKHDLNHTLR